MSKVLMISADSHAAVPPDEYVKWLDPKYRDRVQELIDFNHEVDAVVWESAPDPETEAFIDPRNVLRSGGREGLWDPARRLAELEAEGFVAEVIYPGDRASLGPYFTNLSEPFPPEYRAAGCKAHNRWLAEFCSYAPGRMCGVVQTEVWPDMDAVAAEISWARKAGLGAAGIPRFPGIEPNQPPLTDPAWDKVWAACVDNDMTVAIHIGHHKKQGSEIAHIRTQNYKVTGCPDRAEGGQIHYDAGRRPFWQLIYSGAFDRFPDLRVTFSELRVEWVQPTLAHLERRFDQARFADAGLETPKLRPSDYWRRHCGVAGQLRPYEVGLRHHIGVETVMFGHDYPHAEGAWPNSREWLRLVLKGVPEDEVRMILGGNAARFYGFDVEILARHAERVGPGLSELVSDAPVDPRLIQNLQWRSGFLGQAHRYDPDVVEPFMAEDARAAMSA
jgi:predicted TIM-barrel fold metal-dependent hydrolase